MTASAGARRRILHLGLGAFHRAHQAVVLQRLHDLGDPSWTLASGNVRPDDAPLIAALVASGGSYTLETVSPSGERRYDSIRAISEVLPWDRELRRLIAAGAGAATAIISFTVTEAGYYLDGEDRLDLSHADVVGDLQSVRARGAG